MARAWKSAAFWMAFASGVFVTAPALAADEEIQVYMDEMGAVGRLSLDIHINDAIVGRTTPDYPGEQIPDDRIRITPEFSYTIAPGFDVGAYLPLTEIDRDGNFSADGVKLRFKYLAPHGEEGLFGGVNFEIGRVDKRLDVNPWNAELKGILGVHHGPWTLAANGNIDWAVSGPATGPTTFELAAKVAYQVGEKTAIGLESYNDFGPIRDFTAYRDGDQKLFAVVDTEAGAWDFNFGVGYGYGTPEDRWVLKLIVGTPLGK